MKLKILIGVGCLCLLAALAFLLIPRPSVAERTAKGRVLLDQSQKEFSATDYKAAEQSARQAIKIFRGLSEKFPRGNEFPQHLGHSQWVLSDVLAATGQRDEARKVVADALQVFENSAAKFPNVPYLRQEQAFSLRKIGTLMDSAGEFDGAEGHFSRAADVYAKLVQDYPKDSWYAQEEAYTVWMRAGILERAGRLDDAEGQYREAMRLHETAFKNFPQNSELTNRLQIIQHNLADLLKKQGKPAETNQPST